MFCKNCGRQIPDDAAFCPACGTKRSGGDSFGDERSGRDIKNLPSYAKENDLNRSGDAVIDSDRKKFSLSDSGQKKFSLSDSGKKFSLSGGGDGQKKFSLSEKGKDSGDGIVRISANREPAAPSSAPTGFVNPLKDSGKTVFHDEPAAGQPRPTTQPRPATQPRPVTPEQSAAPNPETTKVIEPEVIVEPKQQKTQSAFDAFYGGGSKENTGAASGGETGFVNPLKNSGDNIQWGSAGDRSETKNAEVVGDPTEINSYMGFAIFTTLCCSLPTGIVAIIFASMVSQQIQAGNYEQAQKYSNLAKTFCWISVILGLFCCGGTSILNSFGEAASAAAGAVSP